MPSKAAHGTYGAENTPPKIGDSLYVCTPKNIILALDPVTGRQRWRFDPKVSDEAIHYTAACRGGGYSAPPGAAAARACTRQFIYSTLAARQLAHDAPPGRIPDVRGVGKESE